MRKSKVFLLLLILVCLSITTPAFSEIKTSTNSEGFVKISDIIPEVIQEIRYFSTYNFVGARIDGYNAPIAYMTKEGVTALRKASEDFKRQGYVIKIYDAYRPQQGVNHFKRWAKDLSDTKMKSTFYPNIDKTKLFKLGFIASRSGHSRGSTIDMTLVNIKTGKEIDMGGVFDFFGEISHHDTKQITAKQKANRKILKDTMTKYGFRPYSNEWWHYTLNNEPYEETYFDFPVE
ncbi:MAG: M15 family metallopeptidase [Synergistaceae bacterium]